MTENGLPERWRLFIALTLPVTCRTELDHCRRQLQRELQAADYDARNLRWPGSERLHLTLHFLGETPASEAEKLSRLLDQAGGAAHAAHVSLSQTGVFPNARRPRILWQGLSGDIDQITSLREDLARGLVALEYTVDTRPFVPHITLARFSAGAPPLPVSLLRPRPASPPHVLGQLCLFRSQLRRSGAEYTALHSVQLPNATK